jgi:putative nucleotidyltransferase with HDIG domain
MIAALQSRVSSWWWWLFGRTAPRTTVAPVSAPAVEVADVPEPAAPATPVSLPSLQVSQEELTKTLLETVQLKALQPVATVVVSDAGDQRTRTLAALENIQQIPSLQSLAKGFAQATSRDDASVAEVVEAVQKDPALCVRVLRMANSAFISPSQRIEDILSAVQMLGVVRVRKIAQALFTMRDAHAVADGFDWRHLWVHGLATAAVAEELEKRLELPGNPRLYLGALLHDVGKIVLSTVSPDAYRGVLIEAWNGVHRLETLEESRLGVGHGEAGVIFAQHCGLGEETVAVIAHHAHPAQAPDHQLSVALVSVANFICKTYGLGFSGARLDESDGDFETLPAWAIILRHTRSQPDFGQLSEQLRTFVSELKPELQSLRNEH